MTRGRGFYRAALARRGAVLAPMAGYTDAPFRQLATEQGALWTVSEMMSAQGVLGAREGRPDPTLDLGRPFVGERDRVVQLFGADPDVVAEAAARVEALYAPAAIDLNLGCPVPKVRGRGGSCLLQTPGVAYAIVSAMRRAVSCDVSAKIRLGWDADVSVDVALGLEAAGADLVVVHGRTAAQRYTGEADWEAVARVAASVRVPVVGSGDVVSAADVHARRTLGVAGVMVGRGAVGNPWLFREAAGGEGAGHADRVAGALRHARLFLDFYGPGASLRPLRKVLPLYFPHRPEWREALVRVETLDDLARIVGEADSVGSAA
ncbi:tRNA dihydrouridine synthase [Deinococcus pimensis]|uniref:tRNA dihydrouridine synthase n=1 Tax=Deinococcus pimensis TaxID=309888 RepID=UPI00048241BD|nr:tRNA-dihydrouridine synthase family protein [Deinococcus pimensis]